VQFHTVTLADSMIVIARYVSVSNSRNAGIDGRAPPEGGVGDRTNEMCD